jgi:hypothetical protein
VVEQAEEGFRPATSSRPEMSVFARRAKYLPVSRADKRQTSVPRRHSRKACTPTGIIDKLNKEINAALADPEFKARLAQLDGSALGGSPAYFDKLIADETEKWRRVIRLANIKPE